MSTKPETNNVRTTERNTISKPTIFKFNSVCRMQFVILRSISTSCMKTSRWWKFSHDRASTALRNGRCETNDGANTYNDRSRGLENDARCCVLWSDWWRICRSIVSSYVRSLEWWVVWMVWRLSVWELCNGVLFNWINVCKDTGNCLESFVGFVYDFWVCVGSLKCRFEELCWLLFRRIKCTISVMIIILLNAEN